MLKHIQEELIFSIDWFVNYPTLKGEACNSAKGKANV